MAFLKRNTRRRRRPPGVDPLGYYLPPFAYADMQVLRQAVEGDQEPRPGQARRLYAHRTHSRPSSATSSSDRTASGPTPRVLEVQFQGVTGNDVDQFKDPKKEVILWPPKYKSGDVRYPYSDAKQ